MGLAKAAVFLCKRRVHEWLSIVALGIIEGITEFLPVSSTGHLLIVQQWLPRQSVLFNTVIQCGAVMAVWAVFHKRVHQLITQWREKTAQDYLSKLLIAFMITGGLGVLLKKTVLRLPDTAVPVAWATLIGGLVILGVEYWLRGRPLKSEITWPVAIVMGLMQIVAMVFPGTSRSGITILAALAMGSNRAMAAEFSFLLGIPTLLAAGLLQIIDAFGDPSKHEALGPLLLGSLISALVAFAVVKWLLKYIQHHSFAAFGWYRLFLGLLILLWLV